MADLNIGAASRTDLDTGLSDYSVDPKAPDSHGEMQDETYWDYSDADQNMGYYKTIPELKKAIDKFVIWTVGKGYRCDARTQAIFEGIRGWGEDTIVSIFMNLLVQKKVFGAGFAEIIRDPATKRLLNIKPLYPGDIRTVVDGGGIIKRYEQRTRNKSQMPKIIRPENMLHCCNDRIANEIKGTSVIEVCKWVIDARNEALTDYRKVLHRNVIPVRIIEIDTDNVAKRDLLIREYEEAIKKGEVLVLPKGTAEIKDTTINIQDPIEWIRYLEAFFYQAVGINRVIASSQEYSEASSKIGYLTFEPMYTCEQTLFEADIWAQLGFRVMFNRPPSLGGFMQDSEEKNTGQTGIQDNEVNAKVGRTE